MSQPPQTIFQAPQPAESQSGLTEHSLILARLAEKAKLPSFQDISIAFEHCTTPGVDKDTAQWTTSIDVLFRAFVYWFLLGAYASHKLRESNSSLDFSPDLQIEAAHEQAMIATDKATFPPLAKTTFAHDFQPWYTRCMDAFTKEDSAVNMFIMAFAVSSVTQLISNALDTAHRSKFASSIASRANARSNEIQNVTVPCPPQHSKYEVYGGDTIRYLGKPYEVIDINTSIRRPTTYVLDDQGHELQLNETDLHTWIDRGATVSSGDDESSTSDIEAAFSRKCLL